MCKGTAFNFANREIDSLYAVLKRYPEKIQLVRNSAELKQAVADHKLAAMIGVEGGHMIEDRMDYIDALHKRGMCYLTLTWNNSTSWATSATDETLHHDQPGKGRSYRAERLWKTNCSSPERPRRNDRPLPSR